VIAYKVLRRTRDGRLTSLVVRGEALVNYSTDDYVRGCPGTGLFCFENSGSARRFAQDFPGEVWKVSIRRPRDRMRLLEAWEGIRFTCRRLTKEWRTNKALLSPRKQWLIVREVKLLEKVA
jgi:hypothetical protein